MQQSFPCPANQIEWADMGTQNGDDIDYHLCLRKVCDKILWLFIASAIAAVVGCVVGNEILIKAGMGVCFACIPALVLVPAILVLYWHFSTLGQSKPIEGDEDRVSDDDDGALGQN